MQILPNCIDERRLQMLLSSGMVSTPQGGHNTVVD